MPPDLQSSYKITTQSKSATLKVKKFLYQDGGGHWQLFVEGQSKEKITPLEKDFKFILLPKNLRRKSKFGYNLKFTSILDLLRFYTSPVSDAFSVIKLKIFEVNN